MNLSTPLMTRLNAGRVEGLVGGADVADGLFCPCGAASRPAVRSVVNGSRETLVRRADSVLGVWRWGVPQRNEMLPAF